MEYPQIQFQLERWTGREYVPHGAPHLTTNPHTAGDYAERARMLGLPSWRMVRTDKARPAKVRKTHKNPAYHERPALDADAQCRAYLDWARPRLITVSVYEGSKWAAIAAGAGFNVRFIDPDEILGPVYPDLDLAEAA